MIQESNDILQDSKKRLEQISVDNRKTTSESCSDKLSEIPSFGPLEEDIASPSTSFEIFKPTFHLLKQPKKKKSTTKKRKMPGVLDLNITLTNVFSDSLFTSDTALLREIKNETNKTLLQKKKCPITPSNSPSSPSTMHEDALDIMYNLETNFVDDGIISFDQTMDDSVDSFSADYLKGFTTTT
jgi:hypothetical protein